jgi:hypothetical protein
VSSPQFLSNAHEHAIKIAEYFIVPKPDDSIAIRLDASVPRSLVHRGVLPTINFNDEPAFMAHEIYNVRADVLLPPELEPFELPIPQH